MLSAWFFVATFSALVDVEAPQQRVAVVVGSNRGMSDEVELRYAERDALKMAKVLVDLGGFRASDVHVVNGKRAEDLRGQLTNVVSKQASGAMLFFYYSGHSDGHNLHMAGTKLPLDEIRTLFDTRSAKVSIAVIDSCKSGALTRAKGARPGPAFDIHVLNEASASGRIFITSSSEDEVAQESDRLEGSFFTHNWVSGLYGGADANNDDLITLEEAYRYAHFKTVEQTIGSTGGVQHPSYRFELSGEGHLVLANLSRSTAELRLGSTSATGEYFVIEANKQLVLSEFQRTLGRAASIRLPPGSYRVRKREKRNLLAVDVEARAGQVVHIHDADMTPIAYVGDTGKGSQANWLFGIDQHGPLISAGIRTGLIPEMGLTRQLRLAYGASWGLVTVEPRGVVRQATVSGLQPITHSELSLGLLLGIRWNLGDLVALAGLEGGVVIFDQDDNKDRLAIAGAEAPSGALPIGLEGMAVARLAYPFFGGLAVTMSAEPGMAVFKQGSTVEWRPTLGATAGLLYSFE